MKLKLYNPNDLETIMELFYKSVHEVCVNEYTLEQLDAWAPKEPDALRWRNSLNKNHTITAVIDGKIVGFGDVGETGYLDRLYVDKAYLHQGVASMILNNLEKYARAKGIKFMHTASLITAKPFFEAKGYQILQEQIVERRGVRIKLFLMEKNL